MTGRRQLTLAVVACTAAAGLVLLAASQNWLTETTVRAEPLPPLTTGRTGGSLVPLLPSLALVALAGAGGLVASRGRGRIGVGLLLVVAGLGIPLSLTGLTGGPALGWVLASAVGGVGVALVGAWAVWRGQWWPSMGARYQRTREPAGDGSVPARTGRDDIAVWDAIDRGEDPTRTDAS